ncbi:hypothetical protein F0236_06970 [Vibrio splendidus]|uniref:restriction endonuclease subunit S n=1 Tax=Vibrio splendidus TaxID=29497 RepID=UPI00148BF222|nr:restriction endonuclease subunit S [Vibrio splendidus]NOJ03492.1 hypothetical protein [Vibrio splendidus]
MSNLVPEGWLINNYGSLLSGKLTNGLYKHADFYHHGNAKILDIAYLFNKDKLNLSSCSSISLSEIETTKYKLCVGDILFNRVSVKPEGVGQCVIVEDHNFDLVYESNIIRSTLNEKLVNPRFISYLLNSESLRKAIFIRAKITAQASIGQEDLLSLELLLPPLPEQKKIAAILTSVDEVIEKTQEQINKLKDLKTGMMQELLTRGVGVDGKPHTEFKDSPVGRIPKGWDVVPISALCSHIVDCVNKTAPVVDYKTPYKMIRTTNVRHGRVDTENVRSVTKETYELWVRRLAPQKGDLIFTREAPVGECGVLEDERGVFLGQRTMMYRADTIKTSSHFLMYSLMSEYGKKQLEDFSGGSTVPHMRVPDCGKILVKIPPKNEQDLIVRSLKSVDAAITNKEAKLQKVNDTKKALMQDLLTGKIRVKVED